MTEVLIVGFVCLSGVWDLFVYLGFAICFCIPPKGGFTVSNAYSIYVPVNSKTLECIKTFNTNYKDSS